MLQLLYALLLAVGLPTAGQAQSYTFTHLAGSTGGPGFEDGTGSTARFLNPNGVAVDAAGNVYVADSANHTIRKLTSGGVSTTLAGLAGASGTADGSGSAARFNTPRNLAVDGSGNVYVADGNNHTIRKVTSSGVVTTLAGLAGTTGTSDGTGSAARFDTPYGVAVDGAGNLYVSDFNNNTVRKVTSVGVVTTLAGLAGSSGSSDGTGSAALFNRPVGVALDSAGNLFVGDNNNFTIRKVTVGGAVTTFAGMAGVSGSTDGTGSAARFSDLTSVAVDSADNVYVADYGNHTIRKVTSGGVVTTLAGLALTSGSVDGTGSGARFLFPTGVAADGAGNVYVADNLNHTIRKVTSGGVVTTLAGLVNLRGSSDGVGSAAQFNLPHGVAVDGGGAVYVGNTGHHTIRKVTSGGVVTTLAGLASLFGSSSDGTGSAARFSFPVGVAVDGAGNVYVADKDNHTIRKVTSAGEVTTLAGSALSPGSSDGTGSAARFDSPQFVTVDGASNLYVSDSGNHTIRKVTSGGEVTTIAGLAGTSGSSDGTGSAARFNLPLGVAIDSDGNVYVADRDNRTIRKVTSAGVVTTLAGLAGSCGSSDGSGSGARFCAPFGLAIDGAGNLFVADSTNHTIRKVTNAGVVTTIAGLAGSSGSSDGGGTAARFNLPYGVAVDGSGRLYVADRTNSKIRVGAPTLADSATVDAATGPAGATRQLGTSTSTATSWEWRLIRRPTGSSLQLSSSSIRNPTFVPEVPGLYIFRLIATSPTGISITTVDLNVTPGPSISMIAPTSGLVAGGTSVTITGSNFSTTGATTVKFGTIAATSVSCTSTTQCSATSPAGSGTVSIRVTVDGKTSADTFPDDFTYTAGPATTCAVFSSAGNFTVGNRPFTVASGDFNGDGRSDLAVANYNSHNVSILLGTGTGTFSASTNYAVGTNPWFVAIGDFNGDARSDLAVVNEISADVSILLGTGMGTFGAATSFAVIANPLTAAVGDFNSDGRSDLAVANANSNVSILLGTGTGTFGAATNFAAGLNPYSVAISDFNGDGLSDLAVANYTSNNVSILLGTGTGTFGAASNFAAGTNPYSLAVSDFNGDGRSDLAVVNVNSNNVSILIGTGTGTFGGPTNFVVGMLPVKVAIGDFNSDGRSDLAVPSETSDNVAILLGTGTGTFGAATLVVSGTNPRSMAIDDFNGDGRSDLAFANDDMARVAIMLNAGCPPAVTSVSPASGPAAGGTVITITGTNFNPTAGETSVSFGGVAATSVSCSSTTNCTATSPASIGVVDVLVMTPFGTSANSVADDFTYLVPIVTSVSPVRGSVAGGTVVTITGSNFSTTAGATTINFGTVAAAAVSCSSTTQCSATSPAGSGTVSVRVTVGGQTSANTFPDDFTYTAGPATTCSSFSAATNFAAGNRPFSVAIGDFNGDGRNDLAVPTFNLNSVAILLGTGSGSFGAAASFAVGSGPSSAAIGDFNGDGRSDLAVSNFASNSVSILLGTGAGTFGTATNFAVGSNPYSVAISDFNGDGRSDLAVANDGSANVSILLGTGTGTFGASTNAATGTNPRTVAAGDFNRDGRSDLAVANFASHNVSVLLGTGTGTFGAAMNLAVGTNPYSVAIGDFNGDGRGDLAVANHGSNNLSILPGTGTGTFSGTTSFGVGTGPNGVAIGDFNGDGRSDVALSNSGSNSVSVLLGTGTGTLGVATSFVVGSEPSFVAIGDFNSDGLSDLAVTNDASANVSILLNAGCPPAVTSINPSTGPAGTVVTITGTDFRTTAGATTVAFSGVAATSVSCSSTTTCSATSPAGTGVANVLVTTAFGTSANTAADDFTYITAPVVSSVSPGNGPVAGGTVVTIRGSNFSTTANATTVKFGAVAATAVTCSSTTQCSATSPAGSGTISVRVTVGGSTSADTVPDDFTYTTSPATTCSNFSAATSSAVGSVPFSMAIADFNGDGQSDMAVANYSSNNVSILLGTGTGTFGAATNFAVGAGPVSLAAGDLNNDGLSDLVVANNISTTVSILLGTGTGTFGAATNFAVGTGPHSVAIGDFNGDGRSDLAVANHDSSSVISILTGTGTGTFVASTTGAAGADPYSVAIGDFNGDGRSDLAIANFNSSNISIMLGTGTGTFGTAANFGVGAEPFSVAIGDLNGDGRSDLAVANRGSNSVSVLLGTGTGSFSAATSFTVGTRPYAVAIGDFNNDGRTDLAAANFSSNNVSVLLGTGVGTFGTATSFVVGTNPGSVAIGDFNADGRSDLSTANHGSNNVSILTNTGCPPAATSVTPSAGPVAGGTTVTITGTDFNTAAGATTVTFGGTTATITSISTTSITVTTPARAAGVVDVAVTTPSGTATRTAAFTYAGVPAISSVSPSSGPLGGAQSVTITGANLAAATVTFGGTATPVTSNTSTSITVTTPARAAGAVDVSVLTAGGTTTAGGAYTYVAAPAISTVSPVSGPAAGAQSVTITGTNLAAATVSFGGTAATVSSNSSTSITVSTPSRAAGVVDVAVTTAGGTATSTAAYTFVVAPTLSAASPSSGPLGGGQSVTITGTNLSSATVSFGGTAATVTSNSATSVTVTTPARSAGVVDLSVTTAGGSATLTGAYTFVTAPSLSAVSPSEGPASGGQSVTITGTNLASATVAFGGTAATVTSNSSTSITVTTPPRAAGVSDVAVTTAGGTASLTAAYTFTAAPTISTVSPASGPLGGGQSVTITGANLAAATVSFGGTAATVTSNTSTSITVTTPARAAGAVDVSVTTAGGTATSTGAYTYIAAPTISTVAPASGPLGGGQSVTITGTNLAAATVDFGGTAATVTSNSGTSITVTTPARAAGAVSVSVTTAGGTATRAAAYTFTTAPTISAALPSSGPLGGGQSVTITGTNLSSASVDFGGSAGSVTSSSATSVTVTTPARAAGVVDLSVTTAGGSATLIGAYTFVTAPSLSLVSPAAGAASGGQSVTITGANLASATVTFGGTAATVTSNSSNSITVTTPARAAGVVDVAVTTAGGTATLTAAYTFTAAPAISTVSPASGPLGGGQTVTITGANLASATVSFGGTAATVTSNTAAAITVSTPARAAGAVDVSVSTAGGTATATGAYTYIAAPTISTVSPASGPLGGGQSVTITGTNLAAATVDFGGTAATVTSNSGTSITVTTPARAAGAVNVSVTTAGGTAVRSAAYTYVSAPTLTAVSPSGGPLGGGQSVTLTGTDLASATVDFGGTAATVTSASATSLTVSTPPRAAGVVDVSVTTPGGTSTRTAAYTYSTAPTVTAVLPASGTTVGGTAVTITGTGFLSGVTVTIGGLSINGLQVVNSSTITGNTAAHASGTVNVIVTNPDGQSVTLPNGFTYASPPVISGFSPAAGIPGTSVSVFGSNFAETSLVEFNGTAATFSIVSSTQLTAAVPSGSTAGKIKVTTPDGSATSVGTFTVGPAIASVAPEAGPAIGGQSVTITGTNLLSATVDIGGTAATVVSSSAGSMTITTPAHAAGLVSISVTTAGGTAIRTSAYTFVAAPAPSAISPARGTTAGGTVVTITGNSFVSGATVTIGGVAVTAPQVVNSTTITATAPAHAPGAVSVVVTNPDGQTGTLSNAYTYFTPPTLTSFSPASGIPGTVVTLLGTNLSGTTLIEFNGVAAVHSVVSSTQLTATVPSASTAGTIRVTTPDGVVTSTDPFTVGPAISTIAPAIGPTSGGQTVTITGTNLTSATVTFGGTAATVTANSATSITALTPARPAGVVDVSVTTAGGTGTKTAAYTYAAAPSLSGVSPSIGPPAGGTAITITGSNFVSGATVTIGGTAATAPQVVNPTTITATTPVHAAGEVNVVVTNPDGQIGTLSNGFTYAQPPAISGFAPNSGFPGLRVSIFGSGFASVTLVEFNGVSANFSIASDVELNAIVPLAATVGRIRLTAPAGIGTSIGNFTVGPTLSTIVPAAGPLAGGQSVTITGANLASANVVEFGGVAVPVISNTSTSITVSTPAHAAGPVDVTVTTLGGTARKTAGYIYAAGPLITAISPPRGGVAGGKVITISGSGFSVGTSVAFGGTPAERVVFIDSATLSVTTPAHAAGVVDVVVTSAGQSVTASGAFNYLAPGALPTITSITPSTGPTAGGTAITIAGTNFSSDAALTIGGELAREIRVTGSTSISAVTPPHVAGAVAVVITNGDGQSVTSASGFTYGCSAVSTPSLTTPSNNAVDTSTSPVLTFSTTAGAFRYDVLVDTVDPPLRVVAKDLAADTSAATISFTPSNLVFGTKYFWRVVAKGDPACLPVSTASSPVQSFTTIQSCAAPPLFTLTSPAANAANLAPTVPLSWTAAPGASRYEVFLGTGSSFSSLGSTSFTTFNATGLAAGTTYSWNVVALASCNETLATGTPRQSFTIGGDCAAAGAFSLTTPASSETNVLPAPELKWLAAANASSYDVFLDTVNPPRLFRAGVARTSISLAGLLPGRTYFWKVVANVACDLTKSSSTPIASFTVRGGCAAPGKPEIKFAPVTVAVGQTYVISWSEVSDLDADGSYVVERSLSSTFTPLLDSQLTGSNFASFASAAEGTVHHRVRAIPSCGASGAGANSEAKSVTVATGRPNVIFTVNPSAVVTNIGESINDKKTRFTIDNISNAPVQVILSRSEINSNPFFTVTDPTDPGAFLITLQPRKPKTFEIRFTGPTNTQANSYQGLVLLNVTNSEFLPYAFVNLKVGGQGSAKPEFRIGSAPTEFLSLPAFSGQDAVRPATEVDIFNPGTTPMELAAEIGPEAWLVPEDGWNATPIQPNSSVRVRLLTRRERAPAGSALPRYTYFTVRTKSGESARLLVQDRETSGSGNGRGSSLDPGVRSYIVPRVVSMTSSAGRSVTTRLRLTNVSGEAVQAELLFTPKGIGGFDASAVRRASILLPGNNVVAFTDPLVQLFGLTPPASGSLEVRAAAGKIGQIDVSSSIATNVDGKGQRDGKMPALIRGEGARVGTPHVVGGLRAGTGIKASLALVETTGIDRASVKVALYDKNGVKQGEQVVELLQYELDEIPNLTSLAAGATSIDAGRLVLTVESGAGAVVGVVTLTDDATDGTAALVGQPVPSPSSSKRASKNLHAASMTPLSWVTPSALTEQRVVPLAVHGALIGSTTHTYRTSLSLTAPLDGVAGFTLRYVAESGAPVDRTVNLATAQSVEYIDVLEELFGIASTANSQGQILISTDRGQVYATLSSTPVGTTAWTLIGSVPVVTPQSEALTGAGGTMQRPLLIDGVEQSTDRSRGTRWSMLLNEISGQAATVTVRLYEAGNRSAAIAEKAFTVAALSQTKLETLFAAMDLDTDLRQKDRTNVMAIVTATGGTGMVAATAVVVDNVTGDAEAILLAPRGGMPATGVARISAVRTGEVAAPLFRRADVNGDGTIAVADIFYMINALFTNGPAPIGSGDANSDGSFSVADIFYLISFLFTNGPAPAP